MNYFESKFYPVGGIEFPEWKGFRVQLMPIVMYDLESIPPAMAHWRPAVKKLFPLAMVIDHTPQVGYLTIDERVVGPKGYHRRPGLHVDGMGDWGKGGGGGWGASGMYMASSVEGCAAWKQMFDGSPEQGTDPGDPNEGNCEHLRAQCREDRRTILEANVIYWCGPMCVHESLPIAEGTKRTFVRLSMPSNEPWPENCTPNPLGIKPSGPIGPPRRIDGAYGYSELVERV